MVILGEVHDNRLHHENQTRAVEALQPRALVFEMLTTEQAAKVAPALRDEAEPLGAALGWAESGWPDFAMYHPIFTAALDAPVYGGALPSDDVRRAASEGAAAVFGPDAADYGLDRPLPAAEQAAREAEQARAHCDALPPGLLPGMVAAQRLRDATIARATLRALDETGGPVAVVTGTGHARLDRGVPHYLAAARPGLSVISVGQLEAVPDEPPPFDLWLVTAPADRLDPCAAFR